MYDVKYTCVILKWRTRTTRVSWVLLHFCAATESSDFQALSNGKNRLTRSIGAISFRQTGNPVHACEREKIELTDRVRDEKINTKLMIKKNNQKYSDGISKGFVG